MEQEILQDLQVRNRELVAENAALASRNKELEQEVVDLACELDPIYCPECGSCGETGCCPPTKCKTVRGLYCDHNLKDYDTLCCEAYVYKQIVGHFKKDVKSFNRFVTPIIEMLQAIENELDYEKRRDKIREIETLVTKL